MQILIKSGVILLAIFVSNFCVNSFPIREFEIRNLNKDDSLNCTICKVAGFLIEQAAQLNQSKEIMVEILVGACIQIKHENPTICRGIVEAYAVSIN